MPRRRIEPLATIPGEPSASPLPAPGLSLALERPDHCPAGLPRYLSDPWNIFDFAIILVGAATSVSTGGSNDMLHDYASIKMLKLLRILRLFSVAASTIALRSA